MFSHIFVGADDVAVSKKFYDAVLGAIGVPEGKIDPKGRVFYRTSTGILGISKPIDGKAATHANGGTIGFACDSAEKVKAFHDAGVANGGKTIEDPPGWREGGGARLLPLLSARSIWQQDLRLASRLTRSTRTEQQQRAGIMPLAAERLATREIGRALVPVKPDGQTL